MSLNIAAGLRPGRQNESYPDLFQPYGGFPDGRVVVEDGHITMPDLPGIGFGKENPT